MVRFHLLLLPILLAAGIILACPHVCRHASGCLWDSDTLQQEKVRYPTTLEIIAGSFLRHSDSFYAWRIADRLKAMKAGNSSPEIYDDIAVAMDKRNMPRSAIEMMHKKDRLFPGLYETYANLGTFEIHAGNLKEGAKWIRKAIEINPDAHFGREKFQLLMVEYLLESPQGGAADDRPPGAPSPRGFAAYVQRRMEEAMQSLAGDSAGNASPLDEASLSAAQRQEWKDGVKGIQGMMRFGRHDSPMLLEALGDLLSAPQMDTDANLLAARAYLRASQLTEPDAERQRLRQLASSVIFQHEDLTIETIEVELKAELEAGEAWQQAVAAMEQKWILDPSLNPEAEFAKLYTQDAASILAAAPTASPPWFQRWLVWAGAALSLGLLCIAAVAGFKFVRNRRRPLAS